MNVSRFLAEWLGSLCGDQQRFLAHDWSSFSTHRKLPQRDTDYDRPHLSQREIRIQRSTSAPQHIICVYLSVLSRPAWSQRIQAPTSPVNIYPFVSVVWDYLVDHAWTPSQRYASVDKRTKATFFDISFQWGPFIHEVKTGNTTSYRGMCVEIMQAMAEKLNFTWVADSLPEIGRALTRFREGEGLMSGGRNAVTRKLAFDWALSFTCRYTVVFPPDGFWGSLVDGVWNGFPRQLETKVRNCHSTEQNSSAGSEPRKGCFWPIWSMLSYQVFPGFAWPNIVGPLVFPERTRVCRLAVWNSSDEWTHKNDWLSVGEQRLKTFFLSEMKNLHNCGCTLKQCAPLFAHKTHIWFENAAFVHERKRGWVNCFHLHSGATQGIANDATLWITLFTAVSGQRTPMSWSRPKCSWMPNVLFSRWSTSIDLWRFPLQGADFSVSPLSQNWRREQVMDFSIHPFYPEEHSVMYAQPPVADRFDIFAKPFKSKVTTEFVQPYVFCTKRIS